MVPSPRTLVFVVAAAGILSSSSAALAQTSLPSPSTEVIADRTPPRMPGVADLFTPLAGDFKRLTASRNLFLAAIGTTTAVSVHAMDSRVASFTWGTGSVQEALEPGQIAGSFLTQAGSALAVYAIGRTTGHARFATIGAEIFRAQLVAQGTTQALKLATQRTRPDGTTLSLPSGHTAAAFATATVLQRELGWKTGAPAYAVATWVAASRMQTHRHFLSDVVAGATVGLLAGRTVTLGRGPARFEVGPALMPGGIGVNVVAVGAR